MRRLADRQSAVDTPARPDSGESLFVTKSVSPDPVLALGCRRRLVRRLDYASGCGRLVQTCAARVHVVLQLAYLPRQTKQRDAEDYGVRTDEPHEGQRA